MRRLPSGPHVPRSLFAGLLVLAGMGCGAPVRAAEAQASQCFYVNQIQGDRALDDRTVLFRVNVSEIYRLDFAQQCPALAYPNPKLIIAPFGGIGLVCQAIDLDVKVSEQGPGRSPRPASRNRCAG